MMMGGYRKLTEEAQQREEWRRQTFELVYKTENQKKKYARVSLYVSKATDKDGPLAKRRALKCFGGF